MELSLNWIISQLFAFVGLLFVIASFQQKNTKKLLILRNIATFFVFAGLCFLGNISATIMCGAGVVRNLTSLYFAYNPKTKKSIKVLASCFIVLLLVGLNIYYWNNWLNIISILVGTLNVIAFMQEKASTIRKLSILSEVVAITYYVLLLSPINMIIEVFGLVSAIVGIFRLDRKKKMV